ncbi:hypothetical protein OC844_005742 [Tilletia horrida]|nr:hypothetical protein OC844_005742 [Tilletia horrida]
MFKFAPLLLLLGLTIRGALTDDTPSISAATAPVRDTTFPACDVPNPVKPNRTKTGVAAPFEISDDNVFFLKPGLGSCGANYTDAQLVACLSPGWMKSAYHNHCFDYVAIADAETGKQIIAQALDTCGAVPNSTFGCNDIYLSKAAFETLGGNTTLGRLTSNVTWNFILNDSSSDTGSSSGGSKCKSTGSAAGAAAKHAQGKKQKRLEPVPLA